MFYPLNYKGISVGSQNRTDLFWASTRRFHQYSFSNISESLLCVTFWSQRCAQRKAGLRRPGRIRTCDICFVGAALLPLNYGPWRHKFSKTGLGGRIWTCGPELPRLVRYQTTLHPVNLLFSFSDCLCQRADFKLFWVTACYVRLEETAH